MKIITLTVFLLMSFASVASSENVNSSDDREFVEMLEQSDSVQWTGCIAIDSNYNPYWGKTAEIALNNCYAHSEIGDCRISRCK